LASKALRAGLSAMELELFGDAKHRMANITGNSEGGARRRDGASRALEHGTKALRASLWHAGNVGWQIAGE